MKVKILTEKEFKKLKRYQILELMIMQTEQIEQLEKKIKELEEKSQEQNIHIEELGSIAEASLAVNEIFKSAQSAADMYLEEAKKKADEIVKSAEIEAKAIRICAENKD